MSISIRSTRAGLATVLVAGAVALVGAGPAGAQDPIDPTQGRGTLGQITGPFICDPEGSPFRQTSECEVDHDGNVETPTVNPYTGTADSPGLLGEEGLGAIGPLGLNELF